MSYYNLFLVYLLVTLAVITVAVVFFLRKTLRRRVLISRSLGLELLSVRFQHYMQPEAGLQLQQLREKISLMEQFYSHLSLIRDNWWHSFFYGKPSFALEITIPHVGEEILFYIAVPKRLVTAVEKVIQGIFPDAQVDKTRDYNIFNPEGVALGSQVIMKGNRYYPLRTYQKLEGDSIKELTNVFTKLAKVGEGAALQIIARPAKRKWRRRLKRHAKLLLQGKKGRDDPVLRAIIELGGSSTASTSYGRPEDYKRLTPAEEDLMRNLDNKAGKALFEVNIRLIASAATEARASSILQGLEIPFAQFTDPNSNGLKIGRAAGRALKNLIFNFSFRSFDEWNKAVLSTEELTSIFHFPNTPLDTPKLKIVRAREASAPANLPQEGLLLGYNQFRGDKSDIRILNEDRRRHLYIIGQTGTGKSAFLKNLIVQDIEAGRGVCFIDPHGQTAEEVLEFVPRHRVQDVIYFNPGDISRPLGLNMLEYDLMFPHHKSLIVDELIGIFNKLFNMSIAGGPIFEQYFRNSALLTMEDPSSGNTLFEVERVLADKSFRDLKLSRSKNIVVNTFWTQIAEKAGGEASLKDMVPYIASKFDGFISHDIMRPIIMQEKSAFNLREVMDSQKILLVNLAKGNLGELNSSLLGLIMVGKILMAAFSRVELEEAKRKDFYLYIDEFQNVTTDSIATILSEARKYRLDLTITHQFIGQLKEEIKKAVFGNVGSMVSFRIGSDDAEFMSKQYKPVFTESDLLHIDNFNCYVKLLLNGQTSPPFSMKTYPPQSGSKENAKIAKEISRTKYGRPRTEIEEEIVQRHGGLL